MVVISEEYSCNFEIEILKQHEEKPDLCLKWVSLYHWNLIRRLIHDLLCSLFGVFFFFSTKACAVSGLFIRGVIKQGVEVRIL